MPPTPPPSPKDSSERVRPVGSAVQIFNHGTSNLTSNSSATNPSRPKRGLSKSGGPARLPTKSLTPSPHTLRRSSAAGMSLAERRVWTRHHFFYIFCSVRSSPQCRAMKTYPSPHRCSATLPSRSYPSSVSCSLGRLTITPSLRSVFFLPTALHPGPPLFV
jgi:hypothetical protein